MVINTCSCRASAICLNFKWPLIWEICCRLHPPLVGCIPWRCRGVYRAFALKRPALEGERWKGVCLISGREGRKTEILITSFVPLAPGHHIFQVATRTFPKLGIWSLLIRTLLNNHYFLLLVKQFKIKITISLPAFQACAPFCTAAGICSSAESGSSKVRVGCGLWAAFWER